MSGKAGWRVYPRERGQSLGPVCTGWRQASSPDLARTPVWISLTVQASPWKEEGQRWRQGASTAAQNIPRLARIPRGTAWSWQPTQDWGCPGPCLLTFIPAKGKLFWMETQESDLSLVSAGSHSDMPANRVASCSTLTPPASSLW